MPQEPLRFVDLFCGIGGFRLACEAVGGECVFSCDINAHSRKTYRANFGEDPQGDLCAVDVSAIPAHDLLCAGFPCQPFSSAGVSARVGLGRSHGFEDRAQGNLFFSIAEVLDAHRPAAFLLENVAALVRHDKGATLSEILRTLREDLSYTTSYAVLDASGLVPQRRKRVYLVGFRDPTTFTFPTLPTVPVALSSVLDASVPDRYTLSPRLWAGLQARKVRQSAEGKGFGYNLCDTRLPSPTLVARYGKDGKEVLVPQGEARLPRRLTPRECARLMGFPEDFRIVVSDTQAYRQFGNSVVVPLVTRLAAAIRKSL